MPSQQRVDRLYAPLARSVIAMILITYTAFTIEAPFTEKPGKFRKHLTFLWGAMINFVIQAPLVGSVAKVGFQHIIGTLLGGLFGLGIIMVPSFNDVFSHAWWMTMSTTVAVVFSIVVLSWYMKIPDTSTMFILACILLVFATENLNGAQYFAESRVIGMVAGVILLQILATTVYPKSATQEVVRNLRSVLMGLCKLNQVAWEHACMHVGLSQKNNDQVNAELSWSVRESFPVSEDSRGFIRMSVGPCRGGACKTVQALIAARLESALMAVYKGLENAEELMPVTRTEIGVRLRRGRWIFLPGLPWRTAPCLPEEEISNVTWSIRKCARILWTLHLTFQDGLDEEMMDMVRQQYPSKLMPTLVESSQECLKDMYESFPNFESVECMNITKFRDAVEAFFGVGDFQRRKIKQHMQKFKDKAMEREQQHNHIYQKVAEMMQTEMNKDPHNGYHHSGIYSRMHRQQGRRISRSQTLNSEGGTLRGVMAALTGRKGLWNMRTRTYDNPLHNDPDREEFREPLLMNSQAGLHGSMSGLTRAHSQVSQGSTTCGSDLDRLHSGSATLSPTFTSAPSELPSILESQQEPAIDNSDSRNAHQPLTNATHEQGALEHLPSNVEVLVGFDSSVPELPEVAPGKSRYQLPRIRTADLKDFPDTPEGYVSMVRWYSFQFLLEELSEEMKELHANLCDLLLKLPDCGIKR